VKNYSAFNIPLETFVTDSQYMDKDQDFTLSPTYLLSDFQVLLRFFMLFFSDLCHRRTPWEAVLLGY
jgi:hypothetical protein